MEWGSIEHRIKVAEKYNVNKQQVIDLPIKEFEAFVAGLGIGEKHAGSEILRYFKEQANKEKEKENGKELQSGTESV